MTEDPIRETQLHRIAVLWQEAAKLAAAVKTQGFTSPLDRDEARRIAKSLHSLLEMLVNELNASQN
jgi:hypothetical protein